MGRVVYECLVFHACPRFCSHACLPSILQLQGRFTMTMQHNRNTFVNKQLVKMQERPNDIPEGETPHAGTLYVFESNVDVCRPGDRVTITGGATHLPQPFTS